MRKDAKDKSAHCFLCAFGTCKGGPPPVVSGTMSPCRCDCHKRDEEKCTGCGRPAWQHTESNPCNLS